MFKTTRTPLSGGNSKMTRSDTLHPRLFVEAKMRKHFSVVTLFCETRELARKEGKMPVVVLQEKGRKKSYAVVPLDRKYIERLLEELK